MTKLESILIVDDDSISSMVTEMMLMHIQAADKITLVNNGKEAIDYLDQSPNNVPELILLDINMPLMNGFDFLDHWERRGLTGSAKIAVFTTSTLPSDREQAHCYSDVIAFVEKPLSENQARKLLQLQYEATFGG